MAHAQGNPTQATFFNSFNVKKIEEQYKSSICTSITYEKWRFCRHSPAREMVARAGAFSNQFLEGMKLLYELEPLIKVKPYLTNQWEKSAGLIKNAS